MENLVIFNVEQLSMKYIIITPVKNEIQYVERMILSVACQSIQPAVHYIFDDDSSDGTYELLIDLEKKYNFINVMRVSNYRPDLKDPNARIPAIFNYVYANTPHDHDFLLKIDADVEFAPDYIQTIFSTFEKDKQLGIAAGRCTSNGKRESLFISNAGPSKFYRKECYEAIGGKLYERQGHDTMDNAAARSLGWKTKIVDAEFHHLKKLGNRVGRIYWHYEKGKYKGAIPYYLPYFLMTLVKNIPNTPFLISSLIQLVGYINTRFIARERWFPVSVSAQLIKEQKNKILNPCKLLTEL